MAIQAEPGLMGVTGFPDGPPVMAGTSIADHLSGLNAFAAVDAELVQSRTTGVGCRVDIAMFDSLLGIPAGLVRSIPEAIESAQAGARHMVFDVEGTALRIPGHPFHVSTLDDSPTRPRAVACDEHGAGLRREFLAPDA